MDKVIFSRNSALVALFALAMLSGCQGGGSSDQNNLGGVTVNPPASNLVDTQISWTIPTTRIQGDFLPMSEIKGYEVYYGTEPGQYSDSVSIDDAQQTSADFSLESGETYYFVVRAIDTDDLEGPESNIVSRSI